MQELEKILEEIDRATDEYGMVDYINDEPVISKNRAKDIIRKHLSHENTTEITRSSQDNDGWIPVDDRLPEEKTNPVTQDFYEYQVTAKFQDIEDIRHYKFGNGHWWHGPGIVDEYVTAWRPLPEPYRAENKTEASDWRQDMLRKFDRRD